MMPSKSEDPNTTNINEILVAESSPEDDENAHESNIAATPFDAFHEKHMRYLGSFSDETSVDSGDEAGELDMQIQKDLAKLSFSPSVDTSPASDDNIIQAAEDHDVTSTSAANAASSETIQPKSTGSEPEASNAHDSHDVQDQHAPATPTHGDQPAGTAVQYPTDHVPMWVSPDGDFMEVRANVYCLVMKNLNRFLTYNALGSWTMEDGRWVRLPFEIEMSIQFQDDWDNSTTVGEFLASTGDGASDNGDDGGVGFVVDPALEDEGFVSMGSNDGSDSDSDDGHGQGAVGQQHGGVTLGEEVEGEGTNGAGM